MSRNKRTILTITISGLILGVSYPLFAGELDQPVALINGLSIGGIGGYIISLFEIYVLNPKNRRYSFPVIVITKTAIYTFLFFFLIIFVKGLADSIAASEPFFQYILGDSFQHFLRKEDFDLILIYSLIMVGFIIFTIQINKKMGQGILLSFITGRLHEPREEVRIFMFLDLKSSTSLAEKMGAVNYHKLLNDFFFDITPSIEKGHGVIYRYVGDQVVLTWKMKDAMQNAHCIMTYFYVRSTINDLKDKYQQKYGFLPAFRAAIHCGQVIRGEIGDIKSQIVFHGEPLYVTGQIEKLCGKLGQDLLVSDPLKNKIQLPTLYTFRKITNSVNLDSGPLPFSLFTVSDNAPDQ
ncbi:adenylate/guanylate cyclase domain-containing protein [Fulvivirgaceae bacterium BMA12]|uniref:Adenylate/guanylate cyclase domain-containing protein n=1 Tax=Agaribacillus aureus TaxID=3051825 RepID=A0ABT8KY65_9BACT|nr:adenylate/guanylate cyclase domain-containing protein [Fulvivirgaceae bacterium BMA12]